MKVAEIQLEIITPMFSHGDKTSEFRITELKSLMRSTFRELYCFESLKDMKEKENILFGSIKRKSPITLTGKCIKSAYGETYEMLPHKDGTKRNCLGSAKKIKFIMISNNQNLDIYIKLLIQASIIGSLGMRSRKGFGSFRISSIKTEGINENKYMPLVEENPIKILRNEANCKDYNIRESTIKKENELEYCKYSDELEYPYTKWIKMVDIRDGEDYESIIRNISQLTHDRLYEDKNKKCFTDDILNSGDIDKNILGNCVSKKRIIGRFASPICVSFWENNRNKYMILKELNYDYILEELYDKREITKRTNEDIFRKANEDYVNKYIKELINIGEGKR